MKGDEPIIRVGPPVTVRMATLETLKPAVGIPEVWPTAVINGM